MPKLAVIVLASLPRLKGEAATAFTQALCRILDALERGVGDYDQKLLTAISPKLIALTQAGGKAARKFNNAASPAG